MAAIDVGSNTILLLVAEHDPITGLTIIDEAEDQTRLGAGLDPTGRLSDVAMERALQSLTRLRDRAVAAGATQMEVVATAAVREAKNGAEFVGRARSKGIPLRVISSEAEAQLAYLSAAYNFPDLGPTVVADIGGGSMELIGALSHEVNLVKSLPLGAVRLSEMDIPSQTLRQHIRNFLEPALDRRVWQYSRVIGSGGTFASLAGVVLAKRSAPSESIQGVRVTQGELEEVLAMLETMPMEQRRKVPGLRPERADIILAGLTVADELLRWVKYPSVTINRYGLREGLLLQMSM